VEGKGPTFSLVYATPMRQHHAQLGLDPAVTTLQACCCRPWTWWCNDATALRDHDDDDDA